MVANLTESKGNATNPFAAELEQIRDALIFDYVSAIELSGALQIDALRAEDQVTELSFLLEYSLLVYANITLTNLTIAPGVFPPALAAQLQANITGICLALGSADARLLNLIGLAPKVGQIIHDRLAHMQQILSNIEHGLFARIEDFVALISANGTAVSANITDRFADWISEYNSSTVTITESGSAGGNVTLTITIVRNGNVNSTTQQKVHDEIQFVAKIILAAHIGCHIDNITVTSVTQTNKRQTSPTNTWSAPVTVGYTSSNPVPAGSGATNEVGAATVAVVIAGVLVALKVALM